MKTKKTRLLSLLLAGLLLLPTLASCAEDTADAAETAGATTESAEIITDPVELALSELRETADWGGEDFGILYNTSIGGSAREVEAQASYSGEGSNAVINDAVFERNTLFEEYCDLNFVLLPVAGENFSTTMINGVQTGTTDFYLCSTSAGDTASSALQGYLYNYLDLNIDYDREWWDQGTLEFALDGRVFFMNGPFNMVDDDVTYFVAFNKKLQQEHQIPNLYKTTTDLEWTMEYMNTLISNLSTDNGDGVWDEKDTYGLTCAGVTTFFYGAGLRYVKNDPELDMPELMLDQNMERALDVLDLTRSIIHDNHSTYLGIGMEIFMQDRSLFGIEVISYLGNLNSNMENGYGVLPPPMFDTNQGRYYTYSNAIGTTLSIPTTAAQKDMDKFSGVLETYCVLSQKLVKPAYYEVTLMTRNVQDLESAEMLDLILSSRVYDMASYFGDLNLSNIFDSAVTGSADNFSSSYKASGKTFNKKMNKLFETLQKSDS